MIALINSYFSSLRINRENTLIGVIWLFQISAILGISTEFKDWFLEKTPLTLLIHIVVLLSLIPARKAWLQARLIIIVLLGSLAEFIGVNYWPIFGEYEYGNNLGFKLWGVPLVIGFNWLILTIISNRLSLEFSQNKWLRYTIAASLMVILDLFMELSATPFDFWHFKGGIPPIENYISWFVLAWVMNAILGNMIDKSSLKLPLHIYLANLSLFAIYAFL